MVLRCNPSVNILAERILIVDLNLNWIVWVLLCVIIFLYCHIFLLLGMVMPYPMVLWELGSLRNISLSFIIMLGNSNLAILEKDLGICTFIHKCLALGLYP